MLSELDAVEIEVIEARKGCDPALVRRRSQLLEDQGFPLLAREAEALSSPQVDDDADWPDEVWTVYEHVSAGQLDLAREVLLSTSPGCAPGLLRARYR